VRTLLRCLAALALSASVTGTAGGAGPESHRGVQLDMAVEGDRLTVRLLDAPLKQVLVELERRAGVRTELVGPSGDETLSESFTALPIEEAVSRLFGGFSFLAVPLGANAAPRMLVYLVPRAGGAAMHAAPRRIPTGELNALTRAMVDPDENVRADAQAKFEQALKSAEAASRSTPRVR
jgi:hypothetical protein